MSKAFRPLVGLAIGSPNDPDLLAIDIIEGNAKIQLLNVYNEADQARVGPKTLERDALWTGLLTSRFYHSPSEHFLD